MIEKQITLAEGAQITLLEVAGDLKVSGWDKVYVQVQVNSNEEEDLLVGESANGPELSARASCEVWVPEGVPVTVRQAMGSMKVREVRAAFKAEQVHGDLRLSNMGEVVVDKAHGNLKAGDLSSLQVVEVVAGDAIVKSMESADLQAVQGNLRAKALDRLKVAHVTGELIVKDVKGLVDAQQVQGNAVLKDVGGMATIEKVVGNLVARDLLGGAKVGRIGGNLVLSGDLGSGCTYQFRTGGNAALKLADDTNASVTLKADGQVMSSAALTEEVRTEKSLSGILGDGGTELAVEAGGNITLGYPGRASWHEDEDELWDEAEDEPGPAGFSLGEEISRQVEESLRAIDVEAISRRASESIERAMAQMRAKLDSIDWEKVGHHAEEAMERALGQMQRELDRLSERASRQQEKVQRMAEQRQRQAQRHAEREAERQQRHAARVRTVAWRAGQPAPAPEPAPSFDEERLSILTMVEQGQITIQEAETLLDALK
ncbi:MAG: hypothetical protein JXM73_07525 [Anaerolineae bacterium]|nr:hypothetical protein [Anaerolineae bacterium]